MDHVAMERAAESREGAAAAEVVAAGAAVAAGAGAAVEAAAGAAVEAAEVASATAADAALDMAEDAAEAATGADAACATDATAETEDAAERALEAHSARRFLYALGQTLLGSEPTAERLAAVDGELLAEALDIVGLAGDFGLAERVAEAREDAEAACSLYTRLFIGPVPPAATPGESTYRSRSKALFRQETLEVRNAYRARGLLPQAYPRVADDHIAIELGFLAALAGRAVEGLQAADAEAVAVAEQASREFLAEHVLRWIDAYADDLSAVGSGSLYESLVRLMAALAHRDAELLAEA